MSKTTDSDADNDPEPCYLCPLCGVPCQARCEACNEIGIPRYSLPPDGFSEGPERTFDPMLADSPPQTDLTMIAYHERKPRP